MCSQVRTLCKQSHVQREMNDKNMEIGQYWVREFMSLSQKYERVRNFSFFAGHNCKVELCCYIFIVIFVVNICQNYIGLY